MIMPASDIDKQKAIARLNGLNNFKNFEKRAIELINNPTFLQQGDFGICGMASAMYVMLIHNPNVFVDLLYAIFNDSPFIGFKEQEVKGKLLYEREEEFNNKAAVNSYVNAGTKLDFVISRTLGRFLLMASSVEYKEQIDFMAQIVGKDKVGDFEKQGDLALTEKGLMLILADVLQIKKGSLIFHIDGETLVDKVNNWFDEKSGKNPFAPAPVLYYSKQLPLEYFDRLLVSTAQPS